MESNSLQWKVVLATIGIIGRYKPNTVWASGYLTAILIIVDKGYILSGRGPSTAKEVSSSRTKTTAAVTLGLSHGKTSTFLSEITDGDVSRSWSY